MSTERVPVNALALFAGRVIAAAAMIGVFAVSSHRLDVAEFGLVVATMAAGFLANSLVTFGTDTLIVRAVAIDRASAWPTVAGSLRLQLLGSVLLVALGGFAVLAGVIPAVVFVQALSLLPLAVVSVAGAVLRGTQVMGRLFVANAFGAVVSLVATLGGFAISDRLVVPIVAVALGATAGALMAGVFAWRELPDRSGGMVEPQQLARATAPFAAMVVLAAVGAQVGVLLVEVVADEPAGGYGAAVRVTEAARLVPAAVIGAFFPAMLTGARDTTRYRRWTQWLGLYALGATAALLAAAGPINRIVFDSQPEGAVLIRILGLSLVLTVVRLRYSFELIADGHERVVLLSAAAGAGIAVGAGLLAAASSSAIGIAWAQVVGVATAVGVLVTAPRWHAEMVASEHRD